MFAVFTEILRILQVFLANFGKKNAPTRIRKKFDFKIFRFKNLLDFRFLNRQKFNPEFLEFDFLIFFSKIWRNVN